MNSSPLIKKQQKIANLIEKGKLKDAIKPLLQLCKQQPDNTDFWLKLASLYGQTNDFPGVLKVCKKIIKMNSHNMAVYSLMGNAHASMGQLQAAHESYDKALKINPNDSGLLNNLGNALYLDNKYEEAAEIFKKVIKQQPNYADAYNNLGNIYKALNENELAINYYQSAVKLNPMLSKTMLNLGHMFADRIGHPEMAEHYFRKTITLEPDNLEAKGGATNMLRFQGKLTEALEMIKQIQHDHPGEAGTFAAEADIYERLGDYDKANSIIQHDLKTGDDMHPMMMGVYTRICKKYDRCEDAITRSEKLITANKLTPNYKQNLHFDLGKLYDNLERYDDAFRHYQAGNEIIDVHFDAAQFKKRLDDNINVFKRETCDNLPKPTVDTTLPVFILGMPRSGTSLTEQILSSHPDVGGAGELNDINDIVACLAMSLKSEQPYPYCISDFDTITMDKLATGYLEKLKSFSPTTRFITDKMPHNFINIGLISMLFPGARIIHCTRDPKDTCLSIYFQSFGWLHPYSSSLERLGFYYQQYTRLMNYWQNEFGIKVHTVNYEEMVSDQEGTTRKLLEFCDLPWDEACIDFHKSKRVVATASYDQVRQKIYKKSSERWKNYEEHITPLIDALNK